MDRGEEKFCCDAPGRVREACARHVERHGLLRGVRRLGLAVSGGADSTALLHLLLPLCRDAGVTATILHLNHGLRSEAESDARFVRQLAEGAGAPFFSEALCIPALRRSGDSLEMAAREARLAFFARATAACGLDAVATGHQADDVAEGLLLRLARGAGAGGLAGLRPRSARPVAAQPGGPCVRLTLLRPLLPLSGAALRAWLRENGLAWREDASNQDLSIPRNRVRHAVLPLLEADWTPDLRARLCQSAEILREDDALLEELAERQLDASVECGKAGTAVLPVAALLRQPVALQRRVLRLWLFRSGQPDAAGLDTVLGLLEQCGSPEAWKRQLSAEALLQCRDGVLELLRDSPPPPDAAAVPLDASLTWGGVEIRAEHDCGRRAEARGVGRYPAVCTLDAERLQHDGLRVRARLPGDRIAPTGLSGSKKLQDLFVDAKIPERLRDAIPVFTCGMEIVWVPGYRVSRHFAVCRADAPSVRITVAERRTGMPASPPGR